MTATELLTCYIDSTRQILNMMRFEQRQESMADLNILRAVCYVLRNADLFGLDTTRTKQVVELFLVMDLANPDFVFPAISGEVNTFMNDFSLNSYLEEDMVDLEPVAVTLSPNWFTGSPIEVNAFINWYID